MTPGINPIAGMQFNGDLTFQEMPGWVCTKNEFDLDVMTRPFMGHGDLLNGFLLANPKYSADSIYPSMARTEYHVEQLEGGMVKCDLIYKGVLDSSLPTVVVTTETTLQTTKVTTDDTSDGDISLQYYAPTSTYRYILPYRQVSPQYTSTQYVGMALQPFNPDPPDYDGTLQHRTADIVTRFMVEQQGLWYTHEVVVAKLVQPTIVISEIPGGD